jgi:hypothetical protein
MVRRAVADKAEEHNRPFDDRALQMPWMAMFESETLD